MENAVKALLIAAGVFMAIMIVSLLVVLYNDVSAYYTQKHKTTMIEQATKFNAKFENYHRNNLRGTELISLMNRIIDYNATESYFEETNYERIKVTIDLVSDKVIEGFKSGYEGKKNQYLMPVITNTTGDNWESDKKLIAITNTPSDMCQEAHSRPANLTMITDNELQLLASKIYNIFVTDEADLDYADDRLYRANMLEDLLGKGIIEVDGVTGIATSKDSEDKIEKIKEITIQYYQYMQFKRAYFDCTEVEYDTETNRIVKMNFRLQTKFDENGVEKPVFD